MAVSGLCTLQMAIPAVFVIFPVTADAGIVSLFTSIFSAEASVAGVSAANSQKMALLEAPVNANVQAASLSDSAGPSVDGDALVADLPVFGEATDLSSIQKTTEISVYKVQTGDTISGIAEKFGISVNTILWANNLKRTDSIKIGQSLIILPISGVQHKVASGDTMQAIAKKYGGDIDEILAYNDLDSSKLKVGDVIVIPGGILPPSATTKPKTTTASKLSTSVSKSIVGFFARPITAGTRTQGIHGTNAVDLADKCGTPLYASAAGTVIVSKSGGSWYGGYGNYVVISHSNGTQTLYSHLKDVYVSEGAQVSQGEQIGTVGATGKVSGPTGCHVHFEVRGASNPF